MGYEVYRLGLKKNIILRPLGDIIYFFLPLSISEGELEDVMDRSYSVVASIQKGL
jgi:adenosylmethionine-8-amino-7-oxononanoate aminotransferase